MPSSTRSKSTWTLLSSSPGPKTYTRPLGLLESGFYYDSLFSRTADTIRCAEVSVLSGLGIDREKVENVWKALKRRYPLLGARVHELPDGEVCFLVSEDRITSCLPNEITFSDKGLESWDDAEAFGDALVNTKEGEDVLDEEMLARVWVLGREGRCDGFYVILAVAHVITDGMSNMLLMRGVLEGLCGAGDGDVMGWDWEERLTLCLALEDLNPANERMSLARRRWRKAIAEVMAGNKLVKLKGGQTIPRRITSHTAFIPALSRTIGFSLSAALSTKIMARCRAEGITFGEAYPIIGQVATARVLLRKYLNYEIGEEEWMWRKREGMYSAGPVNVRRFFESEWEGVGAALGFYRYSIGFLPLGQGSNMKPGEDMPPVGALLTRERFVYRAKEVKKQKRRYLESGVCLEMGEAMLRRRGRVELARDVARKWRSRREGEERLVSAMEQAECGLVICNGGSSMGKVDELLPGEYTGLRLERDVTRLRCRPGEYYLGAKTRYGQMHVHMCLDGNVIEERVAREWLEEVRMALEYYLT